MVGPDNDSHFYRMMQVIPCTGRNNSQSLVKTDRKSNI